MTESKQLNMAFVGCGGIAAAHWRGIQIPRAAHQRDRCSRHQRRAGGGYGRADRCTAIHVAGNGARRGRF